MIDQRICRYIQTIAQYCSFSKAAQVLYVSQPSLSRLVKKIEAELGVPLFDRDTIPLRLTAAGKKYLEYIKRFQNLECEMRNDPAFRMGEQCSALTIGTLPLLGLYALPRLVPIFAEKFPSVDQEIVEFSSREIIQQLEAGKVDLVLTNRRPEQETLVCRKLLSDPILLVAQYNDQMRERFPNCENNINAPVSIPLSQLEDETLIVLRPWQNMRAAAERVCRYYSFAPRRVVEAPSLPSALSLVSGGFGITFICPSYIHSIQPQTPLIYFALDEVEHVTDILAVFRKDAENQLVEAFCSCASEKLGVIQE